MDEYPALAGRKLELLYCFDRLGPLTSQQALRFVVEAELMNYIDVQLALAELTEAGLIVALGDEAVRAHRLTGRGRQTLAFFETRIPAERRVAIDQAVPKWRDVFRRERQISADFAPGLSSSEYIVHMSAHENERLLFDVQLSVVSREQAAAACEAFRERAADVYEALTKLLLSAE